MFSPLLAGPAVPANERSVLPALKGLPWWGAVILAVGATTVGALIDTDSSSALGRWFKMFYLGGCLLAALLVRQRALFTAAAQPPLIAFIVGVSVLYTVSSGTTDSLGTREIVLKVVLPIAMSFPWILLTFLLTLAVVVARWFLVRPTGQPLFGKSTGRRPGSKTKQAAGGAGKRKPADHKPAKKSSPATADGRRPAAAKAATKAAPDAERPRRTRRPAGDAPTGARPASAQAAPSKSIADRPRRRPAAEQQPTPRTARPSTAPADDAHPAPRQRPAKAGEPRTRTSPAPRSTPAPARRAAPQTIPARDPSVPRKTAGQIRDRGAIEDLTAGADDR